MDSVSYISLYDFKIFGSFDLAESAYCQYSVVCTNISQKIPFFPLWNYLTRNTYSSAACITIQVRINNAHRWLPWPQKQVSNGALWNINGTFVIRVTVVWRTVFTLSSQSLQCSHLIVQEKMFHNSWKCWVLYSVRWFKCVERIVNFFQYCKLFLVCHT
jgi:hypothetical protein